MLFSLLLDDDRCHLLLLPSDECVRRRCQDYYRVRLLNSLGLFLGAPGEDIIKLLSLLKELVWLEQLIV